MSRQPGIDPFADEPEAERSARAQAPILPGAGGKLLRLPHGLGEIQKYIYTRMKYPSWGTAGITAFAALSAVAQSHVTIRSYNGLGLNEYFLILAPTGFGKEDLRGAIHTMLDDARMAAPESPRYSVMQWSAPSSQQGLHELLEAHPAQFFVSDEFAEWLAHTRHDPHKQAALGYIMQIYTKAIGVVNVPHAVTRKYEPVKNPRVSILATSTAERILESMTVSHAESGAYNRWVIHVAEQERIEKRYEGLIYDTSQAVRDLVAWVMKLEPSHMSFTTRAWQVFKQEDSEDFDPLKFKDPHLAGRLSEQAIKFAALIALSDQRLEITGEDMVIGFNIRRTIYDRTRALANHDGAISGLHESAQAAEQLTEQFRARSMIYRSNLPKCSRKFERLSVQQQDAVVKHLIGNGVCTADPERPGRLVSQVQHG